MIRFTLSKDQNVQIPGRVCLLCHCIILRHRYHCILQKLQKTVWNANKCISW